MNDVVTSKPPQIREDVLRDPHYPVHKIADRLLPYLRVLVEQFRPEQVILFGSYANGQPDEHSDLDLLIIKELEESVLRDKIRIRRAWWNMPHQKPLLPFDLILVSPLGHHQRLEHSAGFYRTIFTNGLRLVR